MTKGQVARVGICLLLCVVLGLGAAAAAAEKTLTIYWRGTADLLQGLQQVVDVWGRQNGVKVEVLEGTGDWPTYYDKLNIMAVTGVPYDIAMLDMQAIPFGNSGTFIDLSEYIRRDGIDKVLPPAAIQAYTVRGKIYGVAHSMFPQITYYNTALFDAAGLAYPTQDWNSNSWTFSDYLTAAERMTRDTDGDGRYDQFGVHYTPLIVETFGASWIDRATNSINAKDPKLISALQFQQQINMEKKISYKSGVDADHGGGWNQFTGGRIGMSVAGIWMNDYMRNRPFAWGVGVTPKGERRVSNNSVDAFGISMSSPNKDLAWQLIKYLMLDPVGSRDLAAKVLRGVPTTRVGQAVYRQAQESMFPTFRASVAIGGLDHAVIDPFRLTVAFRELEKVKADTIDKAVAGGGPIEAALEELKRLGDPLLQQGM